jgi:hypothetical protein
MKKLLLTSVALCSISTAAAADETLKWRHVQHASSNQAQDVGDIKGHAQSVYKLPGLVLFPDGSTAASLVSGYADVVSGAGAVLGYNLITFNDGSTLRLKYDGVINADATATRHGTYTVIGGTGKYAGAKGDGT